ncbi:histidine ammonia-lyase [Abyssalbus ytuae]|uniref:Histidine ammonia-lyase n=1 Tax=Abyssalbus ytuae TaxID=2926907 RepID=A0A9E6ZNS5_9FLAO|nr:histidine ammonia-lyase [Abyssalbus ytuae]UOB17745.1 histidine ammonia-lyase [Abyssalbus ytuae]
MSKPFLYGKDKLTVSKVLSIAHGQTKAVIDDETGQRILQSEQYVEKIANNTKAVYGINTGFGPLCTTTISAEQTRLLQENILKSHSVGVGEPIDKELSLIMLILKVHSLAKGYSGISKKVIDRILWFIDNDVIPVVPSQGSVGASGDLAPLSHLFLPLIGFGKVFYKNTIQNIDKVYQEHKVTPVQLTPKDGLALINGTQFILAHAVKIVEKLQSILSQADIIGALMLEGLMGSEKPFYPELHATRPYKGNIHVAGRILSLLKDSEISKSHEFCSRVQDPYSLRCMPQIHGASRNAWLHLKETVETELNSVTDNPLVFNEKHTISGGNFHGQPLALPIDYACLAASEIGNVSDRRIYLSLEGEDGLPKLLMKETGINSGFMILQYTTAALASENKGLCFPSSADSIPTSLGQEDHVSMGSIGGRKALKVIENVEKILAIELLCATQAIDFRRPLKSSRVLDKVHDYVRTQIPFADRDRIFYEDIEKAVDIVKSKKLINIVKENTLVPFSSFDDLFEIF